MQRILALAVIAVLVGCEAADEPAATGPAAAAAREHEHDSPTATPLAQTPPTVELLEQELAYGEAQTRNLVGFLAMPADAAEPLPGLLVIHEWWGLNDNIKAMTRQLAARGYVALAVDLYDGEVATVPTDAERLMSTALSEPESVDANLRQAYDYLQKYAFAPAIGSIGWCFGGGLSLRTALLLPGELDAMVMYYGQVILAPDELEPLRAPVLGHFAELDSSIPMSSALAFRRVLGELGKTGQVIIHADVDHAFANPSGGSYHAAKATEAWDMTLAFLDEHLKPK